MERMPGIIVPGQALHIIHRGNNRQTTFYSEEALELIRENTQQCTIVGDDRFQEEIKKYAGKKGDETWARRGP